MGPHTRIIRANLRRGIILGQNFESGFRRRISKKKNHILHVLCLYFLFVFCSVHVMYVFENKVQMYYSKRYKNMLPGHLFTSSILESNVGGMWYTFVQIDRRVFFIYLQYPAHLNVGIRF